MREHQDLRMQTVLRSFTEHLIYTVSIISSRSFLFRSVKTHSLSVFIFFKIHFSEQYRKIELKVQGGGGSRAVEALLFNFVG